MYCIQVQSHCHQECEEQALRWQSIRQWLEQFQETGALSRHECEQYNLSQYALVICSPTDGTPSTKRFPSAKWCPSTLGPYSESLWTQFSKQTGRDRPIPWPLHSPSITPLDWTGGLCKGSGSLSKSGWTSCTNEQFTCFCNTPDVGKQVAWNQVLFGHSENYKLRSYWNMLNLMSCSFK